MIFFTASILLFLWVTYTGMELRKATLAAAIFLVTYMLIGDPSIIFMSILWILFGLLVSLNIPEFRRNYITKRILDVYKALLPKISQTEQEAVDAGNVWWDAELFTGNPNWELLRSNPKAELPSEEQAFLDGPVNELCEMIDEWKVAHKDYDLPQEVYDFVKEKGFFSFIIPKEYGGLEFSPLGLIHIMAKVGSRSGTLASMVGVPNS